MSMDTLFDLADFEETAPPPPAPALPPEMWACGVHAMHREDDEHARDCWGSVCPACGDDVVNGWMLRLNHWGGDGGMCTSLSLRLNHLTFDIRHGQTPSERDLTALDSGWRIAPDGSQIPPAGARAQHGWARVWRDAEGWARWIGEGMR